MGTLSLGTKAPKLVGKLSEKLEKLFDKKKGTSKKITDKCGSFVEIKDFPQIKESWQTNKCNFVCAMSCGK